MSLFQNSLSPPLFVLLLLVLLSGVCFLSMGFVAYSLWFVGNVLSLNTACADG